MAPVLSAAPPAGAGRLGRPAVTWLLMAAMAATVSLAGCRDPGRGPESGPASNQRSGGYDAEELALYREAVRRVEAFERQHRRLLAAGRATRQAKELYQDRLRNWRPSYARLQQNQRQGVRITRHSVVLSTEAASIQSFQDNAAEVVLRRCTEPADTATPRNGSSSSAGADPVVQEVVVYRYENRTWRIGSFRNTGRTCAG